MPLLDYKLLVSARKFLGAGQLTDLQANGFTKLNDRIDVEHCFTRTTTDVNVNGTMLVAVKEESIAIRLENFGHPGMIAEPWGNSEYFGSNDPGSPTAEAKARIKPTAILPDRLSPWMGLLWGRNSL